MFLSNLRVKSPNTKNILENNIFEGMTSMYLNIVTKQFKHFNLQHIFVYFESRIQN